MAAFQPPEQKEPGASPLLVSEDSVVQCTSGAVRITCWGRHSWQKDLIVSEALFLPANSFWKCQPLVDSSEVAALSVSLDGVRAVVYRDGSVSALLATPFKSARRRAGILEAWNLLVRGARSVEPQWQSIDPRQLARNLFLSISDGLLVKQDPEFQEEAIPESFAHAIDWLRKHRHILASKKQLAETVGMSQSTLSNYFRHYCGMGFSRYHTIQRLLLARSVFLADPECRLRDVAFLCGFSSAPLFVRAVRRMLGISPKELRSAVLGSGELPKWSGFRTIRPHEDSGSNPPGHDSDVASDREDRISILVENYTPESVQVSWMEIEKPIPVCVLAPFGATIFDWNAAPVLRLSNLTGSCTRYYHLGRTNASIQWATDEE